jgi:hypothetical protein
MQTCRLFSVRTDLISGDAKFIMLQIPVTVDVTALHIECNRITFRNVTYNYGWNVCTCKPREWALLVWLIPHWPLASVPNVRSRINWLFFFADIVTCVWMLMTSGLLGVSLCFVSAVNGTHEKHWMNGGIFSVPSQCSTTYPNLQLK